MIMCGKSKFGSILYEEELLARVAAKGMDGYMDPVKYNDEVIFPDKVRLNR